MVYTNLYNTDGGYVLAFVGVITNKGGKIRKSASLWK